MSEQCTVRLVHNGHRTSTVGYYNRVLAKFGQNILRTEIPQVKDRILRF